LAIIKEGIKQPQIETHQSLVKFLKANQIDTTNMLCFKDTTALKQFYKEKWGIPNARFFNKNGQFVDYRESPEDCNGMVSEFIKKIDSFNKLPTVGAKRIEDYTGDAVWTRDHKAFVPNLQGYDGYILIYWAKFLGKVNKKKVFEWQTLSRAAEREGVKIKIMTISADYQEFWGVSKKDVPTFDL
jgi:hypothetical protein